MKSQQFFKFHHCISTLALTSLLFGIYVGAEMETKCSDNKNAPMVQQREVGNVKPPKYKVEVYNKCPMCPVINIHLKCGTFPQSLVNPKLFKVLAFDDCVINGGLPLAPLDSFSFNYTHPHMFTFHPSSWEFQCE